MRNDVEVSELVCGTRALSSLNQHRLSILVAQVDWCNHTIGLKDLQDVGEQDRRACDSEVQLGFETDVGREMGQRRRCEHS